MPYEIYLAIFDRIMEQYIEVCLEVPVYIKINIQDFDIDEFNKVNSKLENPIFKHVDLKASKEDSSWPFDSEITIEMLSHPVIKVCKVFAA